MRKRNKILKGVNIPGLILMAALAVGFAAFSEPLYLFMSRIGRVRGVESIYQALTLDPRRDTAARSLLRSQ